MEIYLISNFDETSVAVLCERLVSACAFIDVVGFSRFRNSDLDAHEPFDARAFARDERVSGLVVGPSQRLTPEDVITVIARRPSVVVIAGASSAPRMLLDAATSVTVISVNFSGAIRPATTEESPAA